MVGNAVHVMKMLTDGGCAVQTSGGTMSDSNEPAGLAFALRGSRDLLEKLRYETGCLSTIERHDVLGRAYVAFNCAVTAWHMTDWIWVEMDQGQRERVQALACTNFQLEKTNPRPLQAYVRTASNALRLCELIANGSKHCSLRSPDPGVSTTMADGDGVNWGNPVVSVDGQEILVGDVLWQAVCWWEVFLADWHIAEKAPFVSDGDWS
jgi:hypothetical protein